MEDHSHPDEFFWESEDHLDSMGGTEYCCTGLRDIREEVQKRKNCD